MSLAIHLLGRPRFDRADGEGYSFRSRKSWALLAYLILSQQPPTRARLAALLFAEAEDPVRALRWNLSEIRHGLGDDGSVHGDPVVLQLPADAVVDVEVVFRGTWADAVALPGLGADLLEGMAFRGAATFETWLLSEQRHVAAASEATLHEAALGSMSRGALDAAIGYAVRAAAMSPLDENHQALLIRLYRLAGDDDAAAKQFAACTDTFHEALGVAPGRAVAAAMREPLQVRVEVADDATVEAIIEAGSAAVSAGAVEAGIHELRAAVRLADRSSATRLRVRSRLVLAEALIHSLRGLDEEGVATLYEADEIAFANGFHDAVAQARAELGYVDFLRARYDRAEIWLTDAITFADGSVSTMAKATTYLGSVESDRSNYPRASALLEEAITLSHAVGGQRQAAYGLSMLGRVNLLRGDLDVAAQQLDESIELAGHDHWLAFLPWPQALRGEVQLARGDTAGSAELLQQAFARACQLGDPCWEGISARALALVAEATGETERAFEILADARTRCNRFADSYVWLDGYILDAQCRLGIRHRHADTRCWVETMRELASRTGMRELTVRSLLHGAALGNARDAAAAALLAADIESPSLDALLRSGTARSGVAPVDVG
ncbi:MAG: SARP family transcriptional regulator [Actinomycetota bacterium]|nr:SARP family transcriptional regulator [Actinomycetota bacterium]